MDYRKCPQHSLQIHCRDFPELQKIEESDSVNVVFTLLEN